MIQAQFPPAEIYSRQLHVTSLASVFMDGAAVARIFDQLRPCSAAASSCRPR